MAILKQSTATVTCIGPFVDFTDGATSEEALTVTNAEVFLSKNGGAAGAKNDATSLTHLNGGMYSCTLDATDTGTVGTLCIIVNDTANDARPVMVEHQVIEEAIYDALYVASADGFNSSGQVALLTATQASIDAIETDTTTDIPATLTTIAGYLTTEIADMVAEIVTTSAEPGQGLPPATATRGDKIDYLYKAWRNKSTQTATLYQLFNDASAVVDQKRTISSDGTTLTENEVASGP